MSAFAKIDADRMGAGLFKHPLSPVKGRKVIRNLAPGIARVSFGDPTARRWSEVVLPIGGDLLLFSERIHKELQTLAPRGIEFYPVEVIGTASETLEKKEAPRYVWGRITGEISARVFRDGVEVPPMPETGTIRIDSLRASVVIQLDPSAWDKSDFFAIPNLGMGMIFCSERIMTAAAEYKWPIRFQKADGNHCLNV